MPVTRDASLRSTSMPLCDSSTTTCAPLRALVHDFLQALFLYAEGPVGHEVARIGDRRIGKRLADDGDRHAVHLAHRVGLEHRVVEIDGAHVLREKLDLPGEVLGNRPP